MNVDVLLVRIDVVDLALCRIFGSTQLVHSGLTISVGREHKFLEVHFVGHARAVQVDRISGGLLLNHGILLGPLATWWHHKNQPMLLR